MLLFLPVSKEPIEYVEAVLHFAVVGHARRVPHPQTLASYNDKRIFGGRVVYKSCAAGMSFPRMMLNPLLHRLRHEDALKPVSKLEFRGEISRK